jgi:hypothetical protein
MKKTTLLCVLASLLALTSSVSASQRQDIGGDRPSRSQELQRRIQKEREAKGRTEDLERSRVRREREVEGRGARGQRAKDGRDKAGKKGKAHKKAKAGRKGKARRKQGEAREKRGEARRESKNKSKNPIRAGITGRFERDGRLDRLRIRQRTQGRDRATGSARGGREGALRTRRASRERVLRNNGRRDGRRLPL